MIRESAPPASTSQDASARYVLGLFLLIHVVLNIDRGVLSVIMEPIKHEFHLKDAQLGLLSLGFSFFFALAGLPLGRVVDRGSRKLVLLGSVAFFSVMTSAGALAGSLTQLLWSRFAVGAGEAGGGPAMLSILSDHYPREKRASILSFYYLGPPLGFILTFLVGGWLASAYGWRAVFLIAALPGLLLAAIVAFTIKEPQRGRFDERGDTGHAAWGATFWFLLGQSALRHVVTTTLLTSALSAAVLSWAVSFLIRSHGLPLARAGLFMAVAYGCTGLFGALGGGWLTDRLARRDVRWRAWTVGLFVLAAAPCLMTFLFAPSLISAGLALGCWSMTTGAIYAPGVALSQNLAPPRMRGTVTAMFYLVSNFLGAGTGPIVAGLISDRLAPSVAGQSLRYALLIMSVGYAWAALHFYLAGRSLERDFKRAADRD